MIPLSNTGKLIRKQTKCPCEIARCIGTFIGTDTNFLPGDIFVKEVPRPKYNHHRIPFNINSFPARIRDRFVPFHYIYDTNFFHIFYEIVSYLVFEVKHVTPCSIRCQLKKTYSQINYVIPPHSRTNMNPTQNVFVETHDSDKTRLFIHPRQGSLKDVDTHSAKPLNGVLTYDRVRLITRSIIEESL